MSSSAVIRQAAPEDQHGVVATITAAFAEDPAWRFITNGEFERLAPHFARALFELRVREGTVWVGDDLETVAMWDGPERDRDQHRVDELWRRYRAHAGKDAFERLLVYGDAVASAFPAERYWYLGVLATDPERRRAGLATAVLAPVLEQADRSGIACCLETSTAVNRRFYERRGFSESIEIAVPGGPTTWWLRRPPLTRQ